jgi:hypothetical protein
VLSDKRSKLNDEFEEKSLDLSEEIEGKKAPLYQVRKEIVTGEKEDFAEYVPKFEERHGKLEAQAKEITTVEKETEKKEGKDGDDKKDEDEKDKEPEVDYLKD